MAPRNVNGFSVVSASGLDECNNTTTLDDTIQDTERDKPIKRCTNWYSVPPTLVSCLSHFLAVAAYILGLNLETLPKLPYPFVGNLLDYYIDPFNAWQNGVVLLLLCWGAHFARRFGEVLFLKQFTRTQTLPKFIAKIIIHSLLGFWNGWSVNFHLGYLIYNPILFWVGVIIFFTGQVMSLWTRIKLDRIRKKSSHNDVMRYYTIPKGWMFEYISCPHYLFEVISFIGFALASLTFAAILFAVVTLIVALWRARLRHHYYKNIFDGINGRMRYPTRRKALIPFIY